MSKVTLPEIVNSIEKLPDIPEVVLRVSQMMEDPDINAQKLADVIRLDSSFTTQVLRLCNSAAYGLVRRIETVKEGVAILGFKTLKSMVYTIISRITLYRDVPGYSLSEGDLWYNALSCAVYAKHLAQKVRFPDPELAYTAALLRDIGKVVLGDYIGANYQDIEKLAIEQNMDFSQAEEKVTGFSHTIVGSRVAEKWKLPERMVKVIKYHHKPGLMPVSTSKEDLALVAIVHYADAFCMMLGHGAGNDGLMYNLDQSALQKAGFVVSEEAMEALMGELIGLQSVIKSLADTFK